MKQITEDYCNFEIAKLLKEKEFGIPCRQAYFNGSLVDYTMYGFCDGELLDCPTQSLALKWLREAHKIEICISYGFPFINGKQTYKYFWCPIVVKEDGLEYPMDDPDTAEFCEEMADSYEEAVESAILYVLKNLI